ncbi:MAG: hypothetical protein R6T98_13710 [Desulfatiglandales bacterium]
MHNLSIFLLRIERVEFSEMTGGLRPGGPTPRRELKKAHRL